MIDRIQEYINKKNLFSKKHQLLLAISGGADSVLLFTALRVLGYNIVLAHCNFNLRGEDSDKDEMFVRELGKKFGVKYHIKSFKTKEYAQNNKISIQMAARQMRYKWFDELLLSEKLDFILTGHHKDDNIETFLINLIRGTGISGLCGIKLKSKNIVRPMLKISKQEIESYLVDNKIKFRNDRSNSETKYIRNKIRHQLIPLIREINSNIDDTITNEISIFSGVNKVFQQQVGKVRGSILIEENGTYKIKISDLNSLNNIEVFLFELLKPFGFSQTNQIIKAMHNHSGKVFFSDTYQLIIDREYIIISLFLEPQKEFKIHENETIIKEPLNIKLTICSKKILNSYQNTAQINFDKLSFPLCLRKWKFGDKFRPLGMRKFKKVSDFFIDQKFSILDKQRQWILCSDDSIVWIVGHRIDDRYKIDSNTKKVYIAELL